MSDWLKRRDVCQRCLSGIDDDHDGNCPVCARMDNETAAWMAKTQLKLEINWTDVDSLSVISSMIQ